MRGRRRQSSHRRWCISSRASSRPLTRSKPRAGCLGALPHDGGGGAAGGPRVALVRAGAAACTVFAHFELRAAAACTKLREWDLDGERPAPPQGSAPTQDSPDLHRHTLPCADSPPPELKEGGKNCPSELSVRNEELHGWFTTLTPNRDGMLFSDNGFFFRWYFT